MKNIFAFLFLIMLVTTLSPDRIRMIVNSTNNIPQMYYTEYDASQVQKNSGRLFLRSEIIREPTSNLSL